MLGRPHRIEGVVERGAQRGRQLGFPTANVGKIAEMLPTHGVYAVRVIAGAETYDGVMNVGVRPTVDGVRATQEVHLFDVDLDLYGHRLGVDLIARIREERKFNGLDELKAQIQKDASQARALLATDAATSAAFPSKR